MAIAPAPRAMPRWMAAAVNPAPSIPAGTSTLASATPISSSGWATGTGDQRLVRRMSEHELLGEGAVPGAHGFEDDAVLGVAKEGAFVPVLAVAQLLVELPDPLAQAERVDQAQQPQQHDVVRRVVERQMERTG